MSPEASPLSMPGDSPFSLLPYPTLLPFLQPALGKFPGRTMGEFLGSWRGIPKGWERLHLILGIFLNKVDASSLVQGTESSRSRSRGRRAPLGACWVGG